MKTIFKLIGIFGLYIAVYIGYFAFLNSSIDFGIDYLVWNEITQIFLLVVCVTFLYISLIMVRKTNIEPFKRNISLVLIAAIYSGFLFLVVNAQLFMMKGV